MSRFSFFGGGSLEIYLAQKRNINIIGFDLFDPLICFWNSLIYNPTELANEIETYLPVVTKEQFYTLRQEFLTMEPLKKAAAFFVLNRCSFSGSTLSGGFTSYRMKETGHNPRFGKNNVDLIRSFCLPKNSLYIYLADFSLVLNKYKTEFMYLDPPYVINSKLYGIKGSLHRNFDHKQLSVLLETRNNFVMSYNDCEEVRTLYKNHVILDHLEWSYGMNQTKKSNELLILSYDVKEKLKL